MSKKVICIISCIIIVFSFITVPALAEEGIQNSYYLNSNQDLHISSLDGVEYTIKANTDIPIAMISENEYEIQFYIKTTDGWKSEKCVYNADTLAIEKIEGSEINDELPAGDDSENEEGLNNQGNNVINSSEQDNTSGTSEILIKNDGLISSFMAKKSAQISIDSGEKIVIEEEQTIYKLNSTEDLFILICNSENNIEIGVLDLSSITAQITAGTHLPTDISVVNAINVEIELIELLLNNPIVLNVMTEYYDQFTKKWIKYTDSIEVDQNFLQFENINKAEFTPISSDVLYEYNGDEIIFKGNNLNVQTIQGNNSYLVPFLYYDNELGHRVLLSVKLVEKTIVEVETPADESVEEEPESADSQDVADTAEIGEVNNNEDDILILFLIVLFLIFIAIVLVIILFKIKVINEKIETEKIDESINIGYNSIWNKIIEVKDEICDEIKTVSDEIKVDTAGEVNELGEDSIILDSDFESVNKITLIEIPVIITDSGTETIVLKGVDEESILHVIQTGTEYSVKLASEKISSNLIDNDQLKKIYEFENLPSFGADKVLYEIIDYPVIEPGSKDKEYILRKRGKIICN